MSGKILHPDPHEDTANPYDVRPVSVYGRDRRRGTHQGDQLRPGAALTGTDASARDAIERVKDLGGGEARRVIEAMRRYRGATPVIVIAERDDDRNALVDVAMQFEAAHSPSNTVPTELINWHAKFIGGASERDKLSAAAAHAQKAADLFDEFGALPDGLRRLTLVSDFHTIPFNEANIREYRDVTALISLAPRSGCGVVVSVRQESDLPPAMLDRAHVIRLSVPSTPQINTSYERTRADGTGVLNRDMLQGVPFHFSFRDMYNQWRLAPNLAH